MTEETTNLDIRLNNFVSLAPRLGYGRLASFDASINGLCTVRGLHYHRSADGFYSLKTPRLEKTEAISVELPQRVRRRICSAARKVLFALGELPENETADEPDQVVAKSAASDIAVAKAGKPKAVISNWLDRHEPDDAGLRRVLAA